MYEKIKSLLANQGECGASVADTPMYEKITSCLILRGMWGISADTPMYEKNAVCLFLCCKFLSEPYKYMIQHFFDFHNPLFAEKVDKMKKYEFFFNFF